MTATLTVSPTFTNQAAGTFGVSWDGLVQGTAYPDPETRFALRSGWLSNNETIPMWGGVGLYAEVPGVSGGPVTAQGAQVGRATSISGTLPLLGFSVFDQAYGMVNSPSSPVPLIGSYGQVMYYLLGSGARIAVQMASSLVSLEGGLINAQVSWDFNYQQLIPYQAAFNANVLTNSTWASTNGGQVTFTTTTNHGVAVGSYFTISGCIPAGYNGDYVAITGTTGSTLVAVLLTNPGAITTEGTLVAGGGALACKIERVYASGCMTVNQPDVNNNVSWNRNGAAAVILI
jgi:hypothetical protein